MSPVGTAAPERPPASEPPAPGGVDGPTAEDISRARTRRSTAS